MSKTELKRVVNRRLIVLAIACLVFILCGISVNASRDHAKHKGLSRLTAGLRSVKETAKKARQRVSALNKREDELLEKIDEIKGQEAPDDAEQNQSTMNFAKEELEKIRFEKRALAKKIKACEVNRKCILAEMEVVKEDLTDVQPLNPLEQNIEFRRPIKGRIKSDFSAQKRSLEHA